MEDRISVSEDTVTIGAARFSREDLATTWKAWQAVETALRRLDPPPTPAELERLRAVPTGDGGRNGYNETRQALGA
jgi:hypothetical protein